MPIRRILTFVSVLATLSACGGSLPPPAPDPDLVDILKTRPSLTRFTEALVSSGVAGTLASSGSYTIFAPMDKAVSAPLDEATIRHHILPTRVTFSDMAGENTSYGTLNNDEIEVDVTDQIAVGSALMVESDIQAANGIIHVIDKVLSAAPSPEPLIDQPPLGQGPSADQPAIETAVIPAVAAGNSNVSLR